MTKSEKEAIKTMHTIGYWSVCGGLEVKRIDYGINDYAVIVSHAWQGSLSKVHRLLIHYGEKDDYIILNGARYKFSECLRA